MSGPTRARVTPSRPAARHDAAAAAGPAAGAGRRQPLPPRHRATARAGSTPPRRSSWRPRSGSPASCRSAATCPARAWAVETATAYDAIVAGVAIHPNEAPRLDGTRRARRRRWPRSSGSPARASGCARSARPGSTTSAPAPTASRAQQHSFAAHIDLAQAARQDAGDPRPRRARRRARDARRAGRAGAHRAALLLRRRRRSPGRASTAARSSRSPAR